MPVLSDVTTDGGFVGGRIGCGREPANGVVLGGVGDMAWAHARGNPAPKRRLAVVSATAAAAVRSQR